MLNDGLGFLPCHQNDRWAARPGSEPLPERTDLGTLPLAVPIGCRLLGDVLDPGDRQSSRRVEVHDEA